MTNPYVGMRGTEQLAPERRPSQKMTRRSQPYRKKRGRPKGQTLSAMLKGAPQGLPNPMDAHRQMTKRYHAQMKHHRHRMVQATGHAAAFNQLAAQIRPAVVHQGAHRRYAGRRAR